MYEQSYARTGRIKTAYYRAGEGNKEKLLMLHGNLSSSEFFVPLFPFLENKFDVAAPDLRCFGNTQALPIDATRGYRDWCDDIAEFVRFLGWERFSIIGWSMGGDIAMQYTMDHGDEVASLILVAPGSPFGFGGTRNEEGQPLYPLGLASGGGCANREAVMVISGVNRPLLRDVLNLFYFNPPFTMNREWEDRLVDSISSVKIGLDKYPGNSHLSFVWPFVKAGDKGVLNAMSPNYGNLSGFAKIKNKPPVLWIRGAGDVIISDTSLFDFGYLGKMGRIPGWTGNVPPQPMVSQTRYVMDLYKKGGGEYRECVMPGGHACFLEDPLRFVTEVCGFVSRMSL